MIFFFRFLTTLDYELFVFIVTEHQTSLKGDDFAFAHNKPVQLA